MHLSHKLLLVALGGGAGAVARFAVTEWALHRWGPGFPWGTFMVNISGALLIGLVIGVMLNQVQGVARASAELPWRLLLATGFLGGYTTFSALVWESLALAQSGAWWKAGANLLATVVVGMLAVWVGNMAARLF